MVLIIGRVFFKRVQKPIHHVRRIGRELSKGCMSFRPFEIEGSFSAEHACVVEHGRGSEESDADDGDEGLGEHGSSFLVESNLLIIGTVKNAQKPIHRVRCIGESCGLNQSSYMLISNSTLSRYFARLADPSTTNS